MRKDAKHFNKVAKRAIFAEPRTLQMIFFNTSFYNQIYIVCIEACFNNNDNLAQLFLAPVPMKSKIR